MVSVGLAIIDLPFWLLVGMIAGLFNIIPLIGPYIGAIPGIIIALTTGATCSTAVVGRRVMVVRPADRQPLHHPDRDAAGGEAAPGRGDARPARRRHASPASSGLLLAVPRTAVLKILVGHLWRTYVLGEPIDGDRRRLGGG